MIVSLAYVTIEVVDPEPAFASSQLTCFNSDGNPYGYQTKYVSASDKVEVYKWDSSTGVRTAELEYQNLPGSADEWNNAMMDSNGNLWMIRKDSNRTLYYMDATDSNSNGIADNDPDQVMQWSSGSNNAGTYFEYGGTGYLLSGNGFLKGSSGLLIRIDGTNYDSSGNYTDLSSNLTVNQSISGSLTKAKDFTWLRDGSNFPTLSGQEATFVAYDNTNDQIMLGYLTVSGSNFTIDIRDHALSSPSGWSNSDVGAVFGFGGKHAYMVHNNTGDVRKAEYSGSSWSWSSSLGTVEAGANKNDGAACHQGAPSVDFAPTVSAAEDACSGSDREVDVTLNNSGSNVTVDFIVSYSINSGTPQTFSTVQVSGGATNNTSLTVPAQSNGTTVDITWYAQYTAEDLREPVTSTTALSTITIDTSSCGPSSPSLTVSQSLGSCSTGGGTQTSTLSITNNSGASAYVTVEYSTNGGSSWTVHTDAQEADNLTITNGSTNTSLTATVPHGSAITWRYKASDTSGNWTGLSYSTLSASSTVDCDPDATVTQSLGSCSAANGNQTSTLSILNDESSTIYYLVEYSTNGGSSWTVHTDAQSGDNFLVAAGQTNTSLTATVPHGSAITWRYKDSNVAGSFDSASYSTLTASSTVDCEPDPTVSQSLGNCSASGGYQTSTLSIENTESYTVYVYVEYLSLIHI